LRFTFSLEAVTMFAKNRNLLILSFSLIVVMLGFGMVIPIFPFYIDQLGAGGSALGLLVATAALTELIFGPCGAACPIGRAASRS
jgi:DHA1 family multidrug resistance protein-like MFS transporter